MGRMGVCIAIVVRSQRRLIWSHRELGRAGGLKIQNGWVRMGVGEEGAYDKMRFMRKRYGT